jgi:hypothetical protein
MFSFSFDSERSLLSVVQQGYWSMDEFRAYEAEYLKRHREIRAIHKTYRVLADCRGYDIQSAEVGAAFTILFDKLMADHKGRYAIVAAKTLSKLQAKRALPQPNVQVFQDMESAMGWLFESDAPSA